MDPAFKGVLGGDVSRNWEIIPFILFDCRMMRERKTIFFTEPGSTWDVGRRWSNMLLAGQLPANQHFLIDRIRFQPLHAPLADYEAMRNSGTLSLRIGSTQDWTAPICALIPPPISAPDFNLLAFESVELEPLLLMEKTNFCVIAQHPLLGEDMTSACVMLGGKLARRVL